MEADFGSAGTHSVVMALVSEGRDGSRSSNPNADKTWWRCSGSGETCPETFRGNCRGTREQDTEPPNAHTALQWAGDSTCLHPHAAGTPTPSLWHHKGEKEKKKKKTLAVHKSVLVWWACGYSSDPGAMGWGCVWCPYIFGALSGVHFCPARCPWFAHILLGRLRVGSVKEPPFVGSKGVTWWTQEDAGTAWAFFRCRVWPVWWARSKISIPKRCLHSAPALYCTLPGINQSAKCWKCAAIMQHVKRILLF